MMLPSTATSPATCSFCAGDVRADADIAVGGDQEARRAADHEVDRAVERAAGETRAMLLMRYSWVTLLKPWNCAEAPVLVVEQRAGVGVALFPGSAPRAGERAGGVGEPHVEEVARRVVPMPDRAARSRRRAELPTSVAFTYLARKFGVPGSTTSAVSRRRRCRRWPRRRWAVPRRGRRQQVGRGRPAAERVGVGRPQRIRARW